MGNSESKPSKKQENETIRNSLPSGDSEPNVDTRPRAKTEYKPVNPESKVNDAVADMGYWYMIRHGYSQLVNLIIRPPRAEYDVADLGPSQFEYNGRRFKRTDLDLENKRNMTLKCSHWEPEEQDRPTQHLPCLIYLHGNSSCRLEAITVLRLGLACGMTVFAFDFSGCGQSDGQYISLGHFEKDDLQAVTDYLRQTDRISTIGLWGRSMGAATALLHADRDPSIAGLVLDSAFCDLEELAQEIVEQGRQEGYTIPNFVVKMALKMIRSSIQKQAGFDIRQLRPLDHAETSFIPALFVAAEGDTFIPAHHSQKIHSLYAGDKNFITVPGDHNSQRPQFLYDSVGIFLRAALQIDPKIEIPDASTSKAPWSSKSNATYVLSPEESMINAVLSDSLGISKREDWACDVCTFLNPAVVSTCGMCAAPVSNQNESFELKVNED